MSASSPGRLARALTVVAIIVAVLAPVTEAEEPTPADAKRWDISEVGVGLRIPDGWILATGRDGTRYLRQPGEESKFIDNVVVSLTRIGRSVPPAKIVEARREEVEAHPYDSLLAARIAKISERDVAWVEIKRPVRDRDVRVIEMSFVQGATLVRITASVLEERWKTLGPAVKGVVEGARIDPAPPSAGVPLAGQLDFPTFGASIAPPAGWPSTGPGGPWRLGTWVRLDPDGRINAAIYVEARPVGEGARVEVVAKQIADGHRGKLVPGTTELGGRLARIVTVANPRVETGSLAGAMVSVRGSIAYVIGLIGTSDRTSAEAMESIRQSWRWLELLPAEKALELPLGEPEAVLGDTLRIAVPSVMRPQSTASPATSVALVLHDYAAGAREAMSVLVDVVPEAGDAGLAAQRDRLGAKLAEQLGFEKALTWRRSSSPDEVWITGPHPRSSGEGAQARRERVVYAVTAPRPRDGKKRLAVVTVRVDHVEDEAARRRWDAAVARIVEGVRLPPAGD